jgi:two-component system OmpR family sensor kinase
VKSIRRNLLLWLVGGLLIGSAAVLAATYALTRQQIGSLFDDELRQVALAVHLQEDWLQTGRVRIARPGFSVSVRAYDQTGRVYFETALPTLPGDVPQTFDEGFSRVHTSEGAWRIYTHVTPEGIVQAGQPVATRDELAQELSLPVLMPMLLLIPLLAALIAWVLERGLAPLRETSQRVSDRDASRLDPLPAAEVPQELLPLVEQINALFARLESSLDAQRRFLADAAHELRSPLAALALQAQIAERAQTPQARAAAFEELKRGTERTRRLVQQLLDFARLEPGVRMEPDAAVDMARLAREVVGDHAARADALGVDLGAEAPALAHVLGNESELRSLIANLVDNALRYAPPGSSVTVSVLSLADSIELAVVDEGPGIPASERERVFERFQRLPGDATAGSGLGLSIAKAIAERHHGSIRLEDAKPGLAAKVSLPRRNTPELARHSTAARPAPSEVLVHDRAEN